MAGNLKDKAQFCSAQWEFPLTQEDFKEIEQSIYEVREAVRAPAGVFEPPLEREIYKKDFPWLRMGFIFTRDGHSGYFEFTRDGERLRGMVDDIRAMEQFRRIMMP